MAVFPDIPPQEGVAPTFEMRLKEARFGDGFSQRSGDGLNPLEEQWQVVWNTLRADDFLAIHDFLKGLTSGESFDWTPPLPGAVQQKYSCKAWQPVPHVDGLYSISATFKKENDL